MNIQDLEEIAWMLFNSLQPQLFGNSAEQTAVKTQQGEKDRLACAVVQCGINTVLWLKQTVLIMEGLRHYSNKFNFD